MASPPHQLPYGFDMHGPAHGQMTLGLACSLNNAYLRRYCGTCNTFCDVAMSSAYEPNQAVTPERPDLPEILAAVRGLSWSTAPRGADAAFLPRYVPLVTAHRQSRPRSAGILAVSMGALFPLRRRNRGPRIEPVWDIRKTLHIPRSAPLLLTGNATDKVLEFIWDNPATATDVIASNRFEFVLTPNYSVYLNKCPLEWALNLRRSNLALAELATGCDNVVPVLAVPNTFFASRVVAWINSSPSLTCVAFNMQMMRRRCEFEHQLYALGLLQSAIGRSIHFIITGPSCAERMEMVWRVLRHVTVVSTYTLNSRFT